MTASTSTPLPRIVLVAFTLPTLVLGVMHGPEGQIPSIYAKHAGLSLTALATAMLLTKMFDAVTYPLIGWMSDRTYARSGTRHRWAIAGTLISVVGIWFLQRPPQDVGIVYFAVWTAVTYVGWKVIEIPLQAWSYGLSEDYAQRSRVQAWRALSQVTGVLLFFAVPFLAKALGYSDSTELDFRSLGFAALICVVALPLATLLLVARVPRGASVQMPAPVQQRFGFREVVTAVRDNPPLLRLLAAFLPVNLLSGLAAGVTYLYMDTYLGLSQDYPAIMLLAMSASLIGIPFWSALATRYERHRVWSVGLMIAGFCCSAFALASPGPMALPICYALYPILVFTLSGAVIVYTMSADIVDYGLLHSGQDHGGLYGAMFAFLQKSLQGVSAAAGVALIGLFGFDATAVAQTGGGVFGIKLAMGIAPAIGLIGGAAIVWNYPLTRARVAEIQAALAQRAKHPNP
ncbi:MAG TPA: MFS transporter [Solimonas sp.]|nr:MFS transporter [Solimonas sp.]